LRALDVPGQLAEAGATVVELDVAARLAAGLLALDARRDDVAADTQLAIRLSAAGNGASGQTENNRKSGYCCEKLLQLLLLRVVGFYRDILAALTSKNSMPNNKKPQSPAITTQTGNNCS
jgi:hypothetical protein